MKARPERRPPEIAMLVQRARRVLRESRELIEKLEGQLKQMEYFVQDIQVNIKQVWKRKDNDVLVKVSGPMWRGLPDQDNASAYGTVTETEFKEQYEYQPQKSPYQLNKPMRRNNNSHAEAKALFCKKLQRPK